MPELTRVIAQSLQQEALSATVAVPRIDIWSYTVTGLGPFVSASVKGDLVRVERIEVFGKDCDDMDVVLRITDETRRAIQEVFSTWQPLEWPPYFTPERFSLSGQIWTFRWVDGQGSHKRSGVNAGPCASEVSPYGWSPSTLNEMLAAWVEQARNGGIAISDITTDLLPQKYASNIP